ncbi:MAG: hypothetical protein ACYDAR_09690 [Thermomicrobiales bacterium]
MTLEESRPARRIAGASENVSLVTITQEFGFDRFVIVVEGVPAYRDNETGMQYVPGPLAVELGDQVMKLSRAIETLMASESDPQKSSWPRRIRIDAPPMAGILM